MTGMARAFAAALAFLTICTAVQAQDLRVVTVTRTPFSQVENAADTGFSIDLWDAIAQELGMTYQIDRVATFSGMLEEVEAGRADVGAANISITADRETRMDFSQPIFASGLRVMIPAEQAGGSIWSVLWSKDLAMVALAAFALLVGGGMLMWRFERHAQEYFKGDARDKFFPSFWWALNLVVNGGFEERVPRTILGRIFATQNLARQCQVGDCAARRPVMKQYRPAEAGRLRQADVARHDGAKHFAIKVFDQLHRNFIRKIDARVIHCSEDAEHFETRVYRVADLLDRGRKRGAAPVRRVLALLALAVALASTGCVTFDSGTLAAASTEPIPDTYETLGDPVEGRSCGDVRQGEVLFEPGFKRAIDDALAQVTGANALVDVAYSFESLCMVVRGTPVRLR